MISHRGTTFQFEVTLDFPRVFLYDEPAVNQTFARPLPSASARQGEIAVASTTRIAIVLFWLFRIGMLMEFTGHGAAGISLKEGWVKYFAVYGLDRQTALTLMPIVGSVDIALAILGLVSPRRWALAWCAFWGLMTAWLRPLAGESVWEVLDRAGNYGGPLAFLIFSGFPTTAREWFEPIRIGSPSRLTLKRVAIGLQWITALVLIGHGAYNAILQKPMLLDQYTKAGLTSLPWIGAHFMPILGWFEMGLGLSIAIRPVRPLLLVACVYKLATELLYPMTGYALYEFIERGFTYVAPLALFLLLPHLRDSEGTAAGSGPAETQARSS